MDAITPSFITNREVDQFLGGGDRGPRQRLRLMRDDKSLPTPADLGRVRRYNIALFPRFALVGLMSDLGHLSGASACLATLSKRAFRLAAFQTVADAVRASARDLDAWRFDTLVYEVIERAQPALDEWNAYVEDAERTLHDRFGISFASTPGVIERVASGLCIVTLQEGATARFPAERVAAPVERGRAVAIERVRVMGNEMDFVMPSTAATHDADDQDRELAKWFSQMMAPATPATPATPAAPVVVEDDTHAERLPYRRRSAPRRARWRGASTMTRVPLAG